MRRLPIVAEDLILKIVGNFLQNQSLSFLRSSVTVSARKKYFSRDISVTYDAPNNRVGMN